MREVLEKEYIHAYIQFRTLYTYISESFSTLLKKEKSNYTREEMWSAQAALFAVEDN